MYIKDILYEENIVKRNNNNNNKRAIIKEKVETGLGYYQSTAHISTPSAKLQLSSSSSYSGTSTICYKLIAESIQYTDKVCNLYLIAFGFNFILCDNLVQGK